MESDVSGYGGYSGYGSYGSYGDDFSSSGGYAGTGYVDAGGYSSASDDSTISTSFGTEMSTTSGDTDPTITITGTRLDLEPVIVTFSSIQMGAYSEDGGGGSPTAAQVGNSLGVSANPTPSLTLTPANVDMAKLNSEAKYIGQVMAQMQKQTGREYATIFYTLNGQIYYLQPIAGDASGHEANMTPLFADLPPGAEVIATEHTHPSESGVDEREPSNAETGYDGAAANDVKAVQTIEGATKIGGAPVTSDPHLITYIVGSNDGGPMGVYAYDNNTMLNASSTGSAGPKL